MNQQASIPEIAPAPQQLTGATVFAPLVTRETFARHIGLSVRVIDGWISNGYLPTVKMGKYSLVNVALLSKQCLEHEGGAS
ncbi:hypothetical protein V6U78_07400 [Marinospirillum sp. MEB164]|uniref:Helix-turn-helix domain-containing protein n=1 Tax=Marinospirillum alkalitolerans TaxID=3123374 RepID=A0ABW8PX24_9GAMM